MPREINPAASLRTLCGEVAEADVDESVAISVGDGRRGSGACSASCEQRTDGVVARGDVGQERAE